MVLAKALASAPSERYQDATAFADALRQVAHRDGLLYSAPQLAEHLRAILGRDQALWLSEERAVAVGRPLHAEAARDRARGERGVVNRGGG